MDGIGSSSRNSFLLPSIVKAAVNMRKMHRKTSAIVVHIYTWSASVIMLLVACMWLVHMHVSQNMEITYQDLFLHCLLQVASRCCFFQSPSVVSTILAVTMTVRPVPINIMTDKYY